MSYFCFLEFFDGFSSLVFPGVSLLSLRLWSFSPVDLAVGFGPLLNHPFVFPYSFAFPLWLSFTIAIVMSYRKNCNSDSVAIYYLCGIRGGKMFYTSSGKIKRVSTQIAP